MAALAPMIGGGTIDDATVVNAVVRSWTEAPLFVVSAESTASEVAGVIRSRVQASDRPTAQRRIGPGSRRNHRVCLSAFLMEIGSHEAGRA